LVPLSLHLRWPPPFAHSSLRLGAPLPPLRPRQFSSGFACRQSAAIFGAAKPRRVLPLLLRRCRRVAGPPPAHWQQRALGSPSSPDLLPWRLSAAYGASARLRALCTALAGRSSAATQDMRLGRDRWRQIRTSVGSGSRMSEARTSSGCSDDVLKCSVRLGERKGDDKIQLHHVFG
jgi:hypothetical protein